MTNSRITDTCFDPSTSSLATPPRSDFRPKNIHALEARTDNVIPAIVHGMAWATVRRKEAMAFLWDLGNAHSRPIKPTHGGSKQAWKKSGEVGNSYPV
ncbi:hypothetical protein VTL71DRAFT_1360, partial [Oculimacula yallundae]